ncbi:recombinase family protein [Xanthobacter sp. KR7-225]|uniref:recombinase family protein n=1 Tax=Xanthobacter sp. KR7-225 TaxID=3156613 RepID=UPI0032B53DF7
MGALAPSRQKRLDPSPLLIAQPLNPFRHPKAPSWSLESAIQCPRHCLLSTDPSDVVTVTRLDRLARSTRDLLDISERLSAAGAGLRSLAEPWADTTTPAGRMALTISAGIAEFERSLIAERTGEGRTAARARGVRFGRPPALGGDQVRLVKRLRAEGMSAREIAASLGVHRSTIHRLEQEKS